MKKVLIVIGLVIVCFAIGGGIAYWENLSQKSTMPKTSDTKNIEDSKKLALEHQMAESKTIEEYKLEFSKDKKYSENCFGDKPIDYNMFDANDINAVNQAVACYQLKYNNKRGTKEAEKGYIEFVNFGLDFVEKHNDLMQKAYSMLLIKDGIRISSVKIIEELLDRMFYKYGLKATYGELEFYPEISDLYIYENIAPYLSEEWQILLEGETNFEHPITTFHGYYRITKCELSEMIEFYNDFSEKYPEFSKERGIMNRIIHYKNGLKTYPKVPN